MQIQIWPERRHSFWKQKFCFRKIPTIYFANVKYYYDIIECEQKFRTVYIQLQWHEKVPKRKKATKQQEKWRVEWWMTVILRALHYRVYREKNAKNKTLKFTKSTIKDEIAERRPAFSLKSWIW